MSSFILSHRFFMEFLGSKGKRERGLYLEDKVERGVSGFWDGEGVWGGKERKEECYLFHSAWVSILVIM